MKRKGGEGEEEIYHFMPVIVQGSENPRGGLGRVPTQGVPTQ